MDIQVYNKVDEVGSKVDKSMNLSRLQEVNFVKDTFKINSSTWTSYSYKKWILALYQNTGGNNTINIYDKVGSLLKVFNFPFSGVINYMIELADNKLLVGLNVTNNHYLYILDFDTMNISANYYTFALPTYTEMRSISYVDGKIYYCTSNNNDSSHKLHSVDCNLATKTLSNFTSTIASNTGGRFFAGGIVKLPNGNYLVFSSNMAYEISNLIAYMNSGTYVASYTGIYGKFLRANQFDGSNFNLYDHSRYIIFGNLFISTDTVYGVFVIDFVNKTINHFLRDNSFLYSPLRFSNKIKYKDKYMIVDFKTNNTTLGMPHVYTFNIIAVDVQENLRVFKADTKNIGYTSIASNTSYWYHLIVEDDTVYLLASAGGTTMNSGVSSIELINITDMLEEVYEICS